MARTADELFQHFKEVQYTDKWVEIDDVRYYVVEADLLLNEDQLWDYALQRAALEAAGATAVPEEMQGLVGIRNAQNRVVRWRAGKVLTYAIFKDSFLPTQYPQVVTAMQQATGDWEAVCGVDFEHLAHLDAGGPGVSSEAPLFWVRGVNTGGQVIAAAFFPNDPPSERRVIIDPIFFSPNLSFSPEGVLRHELGHVLGFRHEHIRSGAPPDCPGENLSYTFELTPYDPTSVMHYLCGQKGNLALTITAVDRAGAIAVYGPPNSAFDFHE
ncbi:MAG: hypothetical protein HY328_13490 [Chloroflexi bacterium]|nr:hypothetical protein [Chloroflexota bacterium]